MRGLGGLVAVLVLLSACSGGGEGQPTLTGTPPGISGSPAPSPTATTSAVAAPTLPPEATVRDAEGAAAFAHYYFELVSYAYRTGDTVPMKAVANSECGNCNELVEKIDAHRAKGGTFEGGQIDVLSAQAPPPDSSGISRATVVIDQKPLKQIAKDGTVVALGDGAKEQVLLFYAEYEGESWTVFGFALQDA